MIKREISINEKENVIIDNQLSYHKETIKNKEFNNQLESTIDELIKQYKLEEQKENEEYKNYKDRAEFSKKRGINSIGLRGIETQPILESGRISWKRDYGFALAQYQKLAEILNSSKFISNNIEKDESYKNKVNEDKKRARSRSKILEYKTWKKGNFVFSLTLNFDEDTGDYYNIAGVARIT